MSTYHRFLILHLLSLSTTALTPPNPRLHARKPTDPYIDCGNGGLAPYDGLPPPTAGWPPTYSPAQYTGVLSLCSALQGLTTAHHSRNLGCICHGSNGDHDLQCVESIADPNLYNARLDVGLAGYWSFLGLCSGLCTCVGKDAPKKSEGPSYADLVDAARAAAGDPVGSGMEGQGSDSEGWDGIVNGSLSDASTESEGWGAFNETALSNQCYANCTASAQCTGGCTCKAVAHTFVPGAGGSGPGSSISQFAMACGFASINTGGKRDLEQPCACNGSYVSHACCDSQDGAVWEAPELKLGVVENG